jgi:hypothetical protein
MWIFAVIKQENMASIVFEYIEVFCIYICGGGRKNIDSPNIFGIIKYICKKRVIAQITGKELAKLFKKQGYEETT